MSRLSTSLSIPTRSRLLSSSGWVLWATFIAVWTASLVPFYARGLHLVSDTSLEYAGGGYGSYGIPYVPMPEDVYGTSIFGAIAKSVVFFGPCVFVLIVGGALWKLLTSWRSYSRVGIVLRITALLMTFVLIALSYDMSGKFVIWGLG